MTYTYICDNCESSIEIDHSMSQNPIILCQNCKEKMRIFIHGGSGIIFKGNGWASKNPNSDSSQAKLSSSKLKVQQVDN